MSVANTGFRGGPVGVGGCHSDISVSQRVSGWVLSYHVYLICIPAGHAVHIMKRVFFFVFFLFFFCYLSHTWMHIVSWFLGDLNPDAAAAVLCSSGQNAFIVYKDTDKDTFVLAFRYVSCFQFI